MIDFDAGGSALAVLGALLDRSLTQIAEASADARRFDRELIRATADVWDSNSLPFFRAATADTPSERERRALAALEWMAGFGEERRAWVLEQAAAAGHPVDGLLPPAKPSLPGRDHQGRVMAPVMAMTPRTAESLAADYDLPAAEVRFDSHDARGVAFRPDEEGTSIGIGARGTLRAVTADVSPDDRCWHLSAAGRRADATTPPRESRPAPRGGRRPRSVVSAAAEELLAGFGRRPQPRRRPGLRQPPTRSASARSRSGRPARPRRGSGGSPGSRTWP
ncbi:hypothetical protein ABZ442_30015 [Streptomyces triculaminicus]|uniref:hypothetical protein n=1 Tax=Streptomyces triculaminicus TaxID=2816232 RepID=UPI0033C4E17E